VILVIAILVTSVLLAKNEAKLKQRSIDQLKLEQSQLNSEYEKLEQDKTKTVESLSESKAQLEAKQQEVQQKLDEIEKLKQENNRLQSARQSKLAFLVPTAQASGTTDEKILKLKMCESGNNYAANTGNGYYGAFQYDIGSWGNYGGYARADLAPPEVQDAKFQETYARRGGSPWPMCSKKAGL